MPWDIYGERLTPGYCEVHPHVHEEYPCSVCLSDNKLRHQEEKAYEKYCSQAFDEYCREYRAEWIVDSFTTA